MFLKSIWFKWRASVGDHTVSAHYVPQAGSDSRSLVTPKVSANSLIDPNGSDFCGFIRRIDS